MPHVIIKLWPGKSEAQKQELAERVAETLTSTLNYRDETISVSIEDIPREDWTQLVYDPEIIGKPETLFKKPGYARE